MDERTPLIVRGNGASRKSRQYYSDLDELLHAYKEDLEFIVGTKHDEAEDKSRADNLLSKVVFAANIGLLIAKIGATYVTSGTSLSIISTLLDSVVDITSSIGIWYASHAILHTDSFRYPRGRANLELIAFIFIGLIMGMANLYIMFQSVNRILFLQVDPKITFAALAILVGTIIVKAVLCLLCYRVGTPSSMVLSIDQRNDILTNLAGLLGVVLTKYWTPYADPVAACIIAGYIAFTWSCLVIEQLPILSGKSCSRQEYSRVAKVIVDHSDKIKCIETLLIYHTGLKVRVEAHVVLDPDTKSKIVHDEIEEPLKRKLERLPFVDRAFIHPDYEIDGFEP